MSGRLFVISGPSGSGKSTLVKHVLATVSDLRFSVSYTTRPMRRGEVQGEHYQFVSKDRFCEMIETGFFAEWAEVHGNFYGTPVADIDQWTASGSDVILDIDVQGADRLRGAFSNAVFIFVVPPSAEILERRLRARKSEKEEDIFTRLAIVKKEVACSECYDYIVINKDVEPAAERIEAIIVSTRDDIEHPLRHRMLSLAEQSRTQNVYGRSFLQNFGLA